MVPPGRLVAAGLTDLAPKLLQVEGFAEVAAALAHGESAAVDGAWGSSCALAVAALAEGTERPLLVVLPRPSDLDDFAADVLGFLGTAPEIFPAWETLPQDYSVRDAVYGGRLRVLGRLAGAEPPRVVVTTISALLQPVPSRRDREQGTRRVRVGDSVDTEALLRWLVDCGFERVPAIEVPGEFCLHGGIFDLFPADAEDPVRIELFGNEVESIRRFDAETQRKLEDLTEVELTVLRAGSGGSGTGKSSQKSEGRGPRATGGRKLSRIDSRRERRRPVRAGRLARRGESLSRAPRRCERPLQRPGDDDAAHEIPVGFDRRHCRRQLRHDLPSADRVDRAVPRSTDRST